MTSGGPVDLFRAAEPVGAADPAVQVGAAGSAEPLDVAPPADRVVARGIRGFGYHGVFEHEKREGQTFLVDVTLELDLGPAGASDDLADTVSYAEVAADIVAVIEGPAYDLIESVAARVAELCLARPLVEAVEVTVHKPQAPVGVPFDDVAVMLRRVKAVPVVVALGANLGDPGAALDDASSALARLLSDLRVSARFETDPVGGPEQPVYVNAVATGGTSLAPHRLLGALHAIEATAGRTREVRWGPRTLDLDLISYGEVGTPSEARSASPTLTLPHPRAHERAFVLAPWADVAPDASLRMPDGSVRRVADLLAEVGLTGVRPAPRDDAKVAEVDASPTGTPRDDAKVAEVDASPTGTPRDDAKVAHVDGSDAGTPDRSGA